MRTRGVPLPYYGFILDQSKAVYFIECIIHCFLEGRVNYLRSHKITRSLNFSLTYLLTCGLALKVLYYVFAIMGMELFGNLVRADGDKFFTADNNNGTGNVTAFCGNIKLKDSDFYADRYCNNNFNDILRSLKVLFDLMVVNQWHGIL